MLSDSRLWRAGMAVACGLLMGVGTGCESTPDGGGPVVVEITPPTPLADYTATLPEGVLLPPGFYPLAGQYDPINEEDQYNGWPRYIVCEADEMVMAYVPSQALMMGGGIDLDEVPARRIAVNHFYMDLNEVTNGQFVRYYRSTLPDPNQDCDPPAAFGKYWIPGHNDHFPARHVTWHEAVAYGDWAGKQLPTEAQWEAAARGGDRRIYPWGNDAQSDLTRYLCNAKTGRDDYDGYDFTAPVLNYAAGVSPYGIYNLSGNVWEWCGDWYDPGRYAYPSDQDPPTGLKRGAKAFGDRNYPNPLDKDNRYARVGPLAGGERVIRGGSFTEPIEKCRVDTRAAASPGVRQHNVGFRCVLRLPPQM